MFDFLSRLFNPTGLKRVEGAKNLPNPEAPLLYWVKIDLPGYFYGFVEILKSTLGEQAEVSPVDFDPKNPQGTMIALFKLGDKLEFHSFIPLSEYQKVEGYERFVYTPERFHEAMDELKKKLEERQKLFETTRDAMAKYLASLEELKALLEKLSK